ncbi:bacillithiol biosynthesis deacetylase BshB1 [candidate division KSB3 bacterium]|uniref:Bacillithiol biosynthesis deacetylase BshB1 n=1 Tax=candidate division KSB3 bacterium TaxID=2044937 RepID=A0A2G6K892_9BACT|nr:MAG: bacillithiol biosynthesis deacetylase BshB1 [candidate division KSB3 bacterium]
MLDVLAVGAHPDDCEILMGGTLLVLKQLGYKAGICDMSSGEAGTYGSAEIRKQELQKASALLDLDARKTLDLPDGHIRNTEENRLKIIDVIREYRPEIVFGFRGDRLRHPDHYYAGVLVKECVFLAGLEKIKTDHAPHRPSSLIYYTELLLRDQPDFVVDITAMWQKKLEVIQAYRSQVPVKGEDDSCARTLVHSNAFWELMEARCRMAGGLIGTKYGETFYSDTPAKVQDIPAAFSR